MTQDVDILSPRAADLAEELRRISLSNFRSRSGFGPWLVDSAIGCTRSASPRIATS